MDKITQEELFEEIIIVLMAALKIAGVKDDKINLALECYERIIESRENDEDYDYKKVAEIILSLKETNKELFQ